MRNDNVTILERMRGVPAQSAPSDDTDPNATKVAPDEWAQISRLEGENATLRSALQSIALDCASAARCYENPVKHAFESVTDYARGVLKSIS